jgi:hypothetical protein
MAASGIGAFTAALLIAFPALPAGGIGGGALVLGGARGRGQVHVFAFALVDGVVGFGAISMAATANTTVQLTSLDEPPGPGDERVRRW